jgi:hypothetical protein
VDEPDQTAADRAAPPAAGAADDPSGQVVRDPSGPVAGDPATGRTAPSGLRAVLVYTGLRLVLLLVVWLPLQLLTPLRGIMALLAALVLSGVLSYLVLDRQRDRMSVAVGAVFRRIDERIERSRTAEDDDPETPATADRAETDRTKTEGTETVRPAEPGQAETA